MTNKTDQQMSQLIDGEISYEDSLKLLESLKANSESLDKMARYEAVSAALKSDTFFSIKSDFAESVSRKISQEPTIMTGKRVNRRSNSTSHPYWTWSAVAASVMFVAVFATNSPVNLNTKQDSPFLFGSQGQPLVVRQQTIMPSIFSHQEVRKDPVTTSKMARYLQAHNSSRYAGSSTSMYPYSKVVSWEQE